MISFVENFIGFCVALFNLALILIFTLFLVAGVCDFLKFNEAREAAREAAKTVNQ